MAAQEIEKYDPQLPAGLSGLSKEALSALSEDAVGDLLRGYARLGRFTQWVLGDIAAHVGIQYGDGRLREHAKEAGIEYNTLIEYRRVSQAYGEKSRRLDISWSVHQVFAAERDRLVLIGRDGWTVAAARDAVAYRRSRRGALPATKSTQPREPIAQVRAERDAARQELAQIRREEADARQARSAAIAAQMDQPGCAPDRPCHKKITELQARVAELEADLAKVREWARDYQDEYGRFEDIARRLHGVRPAAQELQNSAV
jgi:hypothetical protein